MALVDSFTPLWTGNRRMANENGNGSWSGNFISRITPGTWITIVLIIGGAFVTWTNMQSSLKQQTDALAELKAQVTQLATTDYVARVERQSADGIATVRAMVTTGLDGLNSRVSLLGDRTSTTSNALAATQADVANNKDSINELRRQMLSWRYRSDISPSMTAPGSPLR